MEVKESIFFYYLLFPRNYRFLEVKSHHIFHCEWCYLLLEAKLYFNGSREDLKMDYHLDYLLKNLLTLQFDRKSH